MGRSSDGWPEVKVGDVLTLRNGRAFKSSEWRTGGTPIIRIQNLKSADAPFNYFDSELPDQFAVRTGDLLFAWSGTPGTSFGAHVWDGPDAWLNQHIFRVDFSPQYFDRDFLGTRSTVMLARTSNRRRVALGWLTLRRRSSMRLFYPCHRSMCSA